MLSAWLLGNPKFASSINATVMILQISQVIVPLTQFAKKERTTLFLQIRLTK